MEWSKLTLLFFNFLSQSLVWFHHPSSNLCNYTGRGYIICLHKALPEIHQCIWKVPYRVQFLCVGQAAYTCTVGISKKWNTCLHSLLISYNLGHSDFHINDLILGRLMPLEQGLPEIRACPWLLAWEGGPFSRNALLLGHLLTLIYRGCWTGLCVGVKKKLIRAMKLLDWAAVGICFLTHFE